MCLSRECNRGRRAGESSPTRRCLRQLPRPRERAAFVEERHEAGDSGRMPPRSDARAGKDISETSIEHPQPGCYWQCRVRHEGEGGYTHAG
ncbi:unnamed protein product [Ectocarpus sp. 12 AP-2014]